MTDSNVLCLDEPKTAAPDPHAELIASMRPFTKESRAKSWWHLWSTLGLMAATIAGAAIAPWWPLQAALAVLASLVMVRAFIIYHDYMHGSILKRSPLAAAIMFPFGLLFLTPPGAWKRAHNFHHAHVGKISCSNIGSFPIMTTAMWREASFFQRLGYRITRHPLTLALAYITVFAFGHAIDTFMRRPLKAWDSGLALFAHGGLIALLWIFFGFWVPFFTVILPFALAAALGAYLFYAQHNFKGMRVLSPKEWAFGRAALEASSYLKLGPLMSWFTGNIGYHHIHHLNLTIPFYRLPETMKAIPALQRVNTTTLHVRDVAACLRLKLWDEERGCMVGFRGARLRTA